MHFSCILSQFIVLFHLFSLTIACKGCVNLDEYNFDKIISRFEVVVVKFDVGYPYGEKHDAFTSVANEIKNNENLLFAEVGIKDYGEREGEKLGKKYAINSKDDLPAIRLFVKGEDEPFTYEKNRAWSEESIKKFIREHTNIYLGLAGCLEKFDKLAMRFSGLEDSLSVLEETEAEAKKVSNEKEKTIAHTYIKFMKKIIDVGDSFVYDEKRRLGKILKEGKVNANKKEELTHRLNILASFTPAKVEL